MLIGNQYLQLILGAGLFIDNGLNLLQAALDHHRLFYPLLSELHISEVVHLLFDELQYLVDLLDEIHLLDHLAFLDLLHVHLLLYLPNLPLLVVLGLVVAVYLLRLPPLLPVEVQQKQFCEGVGPLLDLVVAGELSRGKLDTILVGEFQLELLERRVLSE
jgi:hypothetical protein